MNTTDATAWRYKMPNFRESVRGAVLKALGKDTTAPAAGDDLGAMFARRLGVPVVKRKRKRRVVRVVPNRADRRRDTNPGRSRTGHYSPLATRKPHRPAVTPAAPIDSKENAA